MLLVCKNVSVGDGKMSEFDGLDKRSDGWDDREGGRCMTKDLNNSTETV